MQIFTEKTTGQMRCYVGKDNLIYLNVADTAIGLGFTAEDGEGEVILWNVVRNLLKRCGYNKKVNADDYIPENMFYLLAMKADNDAATKFQMWIANEVIPSIRKTGTYTMGDISERQEVRKTQIKTRKDATGVYEMYAVYAKKQGDNRKVGRIYAKFSKLANNVSGIPNGCRDLATAKQLKICAMTEKIIAETILRGIALNLHYKEIEENVMTKGAEIIQLTVNQFQLLR